MGDEREKSVGDETYLDIAESYGPAGWGLECG